MGAVMVRRLVGIAHVADMDSIDGEGRRRRPGTAAGWGQEQGHFTPPGCTWVPVWLPAFALLRLGALVLARVQHRTHSVALPPPLVPRRCRCARRVRAPRAAPWPPAAGCGRGGGGRAAADRPCRVGAAGWPAALLPFDVMTLASLLQLVPLLPLLPLLILLVHPAWFCASELLHPRPLCPHSGSNPAAGAPSCLAGTMIFHTGRISNK